MKEEDFKGNIFFVIIIKFIFFVASSEGISLILLFAVAIAIQITDEPLAKILKYLFTFY